MFGSVRQCSTDVRQQVVHSVTPTIQKMLPRQLNNAQSVALSSKSYKEICTFCSHQVHSLTQDTMDSKTLASEIVEAGADKVLEKNPKRVDDAVANTVIKRGANALESGVSKGNIDPAVGAAAEVANWQSSACMCQCLCEARLQTATCTSDQACQRPLQGVRHSKPTEVVEEIKAQLKDKVQPAGNPLADVIVAAGKDKLSKKPDDKQSDLTSERQSHTQSLTCHDGSPEQQHDKSRKLQLCLY